MVMAISTIAGEGKEKEPIEINLDELKFIKKNILKKTSIILNFEGGGLETKDLIKIINSIPSKNRKRVQSLNLNNNNLEALPDEITKFKNLYDLHLSVNPLKELNPKIGELDLGIIWLCETPLTALPEESILKLKNLTILNLGEHIILSDDFVKNVSENVRFTFDGEEGKEKFLEAKKRMKK
jgi:hypothetical protein